MPSQNPYQDPALCGKLLKDLEKTLQGRQFRFMEVCGTHTVSLFQSGLRSMLPEGIVHLSGPGCPVCVTDDSEVELFLRLARQKDVIIATFGDLLRVPGPEGDTLKDARSRGAHIEIVYSPLEALKLARENRQKQVVFPGIGFETTAPTVAATILNARDLKLANFSVLSFHKLVPPALFSILSDPACKVDAFLLPGHVATIIGLEPFFPLASQFDKAASVAGFEPVDLLLALNQMASNFMAGKSAVLNAYPRAVDAAGNPHARDLMGRVFKTVPARWRGLGRIADSGLGIREEFAEFDAMRKFALEPLQTRSLPGCMCGAVLKGAIEPGQCPLFGKKCTPATPVGPCMVSTEGSCAAHYKYGEHG